MSYRDAITLPPDEYLIVDPCYVLKDKEYQKMLDSTWGSNTITENAYTLKGKKMVVYGTAYGDGGYKNTHNSNEVLVDSGQIAIIPTSCITKKSVKENIENGILVTFANHFECYDDNGTLNFGSVSVDTAQEDDEDEDYWYSDDEDDWDSDEDEDEDED